MKNGTINTLLKYSNVPEKFIYKSNIMKEIYYEMKRCARLANTILLIGESGVGKDRIAREIHNMSQRKDHPFLCVPIHSLNKTLIESELFGYEKGAFSGADHNKPGRFEATDGGTIYLPEISDLPESIQLKLLYFLQYRTITRVGQNPYHDEKTVDVRLIMATNENIDSLVDSGKLRTDFYHRINVFNIYIPPLRERKEDIEPLVRYNIAKFSDMLYKKEFDIDQSVIDYFMDYNWPGNVRELEHVIERSLIKLPIEFVEDSYKHVLTSEHFHELDYPSRKAINSENGKNQKDTDDLISLHSSNEIIDYNTAQLIFKKKYFTNLLNRTKGNITQAAKLSKLSPQGLRKILKQININLKST